MWRFSPLFATKPWKDPGVSWVGAIFILVQCRKLTIRSPQSSLFQTNPSQTPIVNSSFFNCSLGMHSPCPRGSSGLGLGCGLCYNRYKIVIRSSYIFRFFSGLFTGHGMNRPDVEVFNISWVGSGRVASGQEGLQHFTHRVGFGI